MKSTWVKSAEAQQAIREGGKLLGIILADVAAAVRPGISTKELDDMAQTMIAGVGGRAAFLGYKIHPRIPAYPAALCVSVNDEVVHGIPRANRILQAGDIVGLDIGMEWPYKKGQPGFYTDTALSVGVGAVAEEDKLLMQRTYQSLLAGIAAARGGKTIKDISRAIESSLRPFGYGVVRDLVGHSVGYEVHEEPQVPNFFEPTNDDIVLVPGMVLALEPMVNRGGAAVEVATDNWTYKTVDKSRSAHFEHTIIITEAGADIVTLRPHEA